MDAKQAVQIIRDDLAKLKNDAFESVTIDSLESVLRRIDELSDLSGKELAREIEHYKAVSAASLADTTPKDHYIWKCFVLSFLTVRAR